MIDASARRALWPSRPPRLEVRGSSYERGALGRRLLHFAHRRQLARAVALAPRVVTLAIIGALIVTVPAAWLGGHELLVPVGIATMATGALLLVTVALHVPQPHDVALAYDRRAQLKERLSTATAELRNVDGDVRELQHADALAVAQHLDPDQAFPLGASQRDLLTLAIAAVALAGWIVASALSPFLQGVSAPLPLDEGAAVPSDTGAAAPEAPGSELAEFDPATAAEIERMQAAIEELRAQIDPEVRDAQRALREASEILRLSNEGRQLGRELGNQEYDAAADELRRLAAELAELSAVQREELGQRLGESADAATDDPRLAQQFDELAKAFEGGQISDARSALNELASTLEAIADSAEGNSSMQQELADLESRLAELLENAMLATGQPGESEADGSGMTGPGGLEGDGQGTPQGQAEGGTAGIGDSAAEGQEVPASVENMPADQRLNVEGQLETVQIAPTEEGQDTVERPVLELGTDASREHEPSAGNRGIAVGRPDASRELPADLQILLDRYFSTP